MLWAAFVIAGQLLDRLVPTTFLFLTWVGACRDSAIAQCRIGLFAIPSLSLACALVGVAHVVLPRGVARDASLRAQNRRTFRAALLGAVCFVAAACAVPVLAGGAYDAVLHWLPEFAALAGSALVLLSPPFAAGTDQSDG